MVDFVQIVLLEHCYNVAHSLAGALSQLVDQEDSNYDSAIAFNRIARYN